MTALKSKELTLFVQTAINFDDDVRDLERLSHAIQEAPLEKESGFNRAQKLLTHFSECGARVGEGVKILAQELEGSRLRAEKAAELVASRAADFKVRKEQVEDMLNRFQSLGNMARTLTSEISESKKKAEANGNGGVLSTYLPELESRLNGILEEASKLRDDARAADMKTLEQNADSLSQNLGAAKKRLLSLV